MTIEAALLISGVSVAFAIYQGVTNMKRNKENDDRKDASRLTTVIIKLETIGSGIVEIKNEMSSVKCDIKEDRERIIKVEEAIKSFHKRLDALEARKYAKNTAGEGNE